MNETTQTANKRPLKVFIVEDSVHVRERLMDFLHTPGEVEVVGFAETERDSVTALTSTQVDAAIVDIQLKQGNGLEVIRQVRNSKLPRQPKIIVLTNHPFPELKNRAMSVGADFFFDKSIDYDIVKRTLSDLGPTSN